MVEGHWRGRARSKNLADQKQLLAVLNAEEIGITLSEEDQLDPEQSTSAIVVHDPQASISRCEIGAGRSADSSGNSPETGRGMLDACLEESAISIYIRCLGRPTGGKTIRSSSGIFGP
jgi:hypothetical protein